jgi:hypothetical protein
MQEGKVGREGEERMKIIENEKEGKERKIIL